MFCRTLVLLLIQSKAINKFYPSDNFTVSRVVIRGTLSTMTLRLRAFLIAVWLFTVRLMEIAKETAAFQIMHKYIAILQFL